MKGKRGQTRESNLAQKYKTSGQCTTVMIRNIPNEYTQDDLILEVSQSMGTSDIFDFFYLPWDSQNNGNVGYAFVNFHNSVIAQKAVRVFSSYKFRLHESTKVGQVSPAHIQGLENNLRHLQDRAVVHGNLPCSPVVMWKGQKIELSIIFQELKVQDTLRKFSAPHSMPSSGELFHQDEHDGMYVGGGGLGDDGSIDGHYGTHVAAASQAGGCHPGQAVEANFAELLDRAAGKTPHLGVANLVAGSNSSAGVEHLWARGSMHAGAMSGPGVPMQQHGPSAGGAGHMHGALQQPAGMHLPGQHLGQQHAGCGSGAAMGGAAMGAAAMGGPAMGGAAVSSAAMGGLPPGGHVLAHGFPGGGHHSESGQHGHGFRPGVAVPGSFPNNPYPGSQNLGGGGGGFGYAASSGPCAGAAAGGQRHGGSGACGAGGVNYMANSSPGHGPGAVAGHFLAGAGLQAACSTGPCSADLEPQRAPAALPLSMATHGPKDSFWEDEEPCQPLMLHPIGGQQLQQQQPQQLLQQLQPQHGHMMLHEQALAPRSAPSISPQVGHFNPPASTPVLPSSLNTLANRFGIVTPQIAKPMSSRGFRPGGFPHGYLAPVPDVSNAFNSQSGSETSSAPQSMSSTRPPVYSAVPPGFSPMNGSQRGGGADGKSADGGPTPAPWPATAGVEPALEGPTAASHGNGPFPVGRVSAPPSASGRPPPPPLAPPPAARGGANQPMDGTLTPPSEAKVREVEFWEGGERQQPHAEGIRDISVQNAHQDVLQKFLQKFG